MTTTHAEIIASDIPAPRGHFAHAVRTASALYVSGLLALDQQGQIRDPGDAAAQTHHIMRSLDAILRASGLSRHQVVKLTIYVTDIEDRLAVGAARADYFGERRPASTLVEVSRLAADGATVEIDVIADVPAP